MNKPEYSNTITKLATIPQAVERYKLGRTKLMEIRRLPPVRKDDTEEISKRLNDYFAICSANSLLPTVEGMTIALGVSRQSLWKWENNDYEG